MNTPNNKRSQSSKIAIEAAFIELLETYDIRKISVQSICTLAHVNRTTFYAHYLDIFDLQGQIEIQLSEGLNQIFQKFTNRISQLHQAFCEMFDFIGKHKGFYKSYLARHVSLSIFDILLQEPLLNTLHKDGDRPNFCSSNALNYHVSFFTAGLGEIIRIWLNNNCKETPEELANIIYEEYSR